MTPKPSSVEGLLGEGSPLSALLPRFQPRPEQLTMARAVDRALRERSYLLAEAGTGIGKTLAYLVPAVLSGRRVVISTATKTLQEQLVHKDIPLVQEMYGEMQGSLRLPFEAAVLKGRQNYLCLERLEGFDQIPPDEPQFWEEIRDWAQVTTTGDRAELDLPEGLELWKRLSTTAESCLGPTCPRYQACFVTRARSRAAEAQLVVVNHHLFFADLGLRSGGREGVLPEYDAVIFDEAHAIEDIASDFFGHHVSTWALEELVRDAAPSPLQAQDGLRGALSLSLPGRPAALAAAAPRRLGLAESSSVRLGPGGMARILEESQAVLEALEAIAAVGSDAEEPALQALSRRATQLRDALAFIREAAGSDHVFWAERRGRGLSLRAAPIDVAEEMRHRLYPEVDTVIFTSGTLTTEGRFDFFQQRLGLGPGLGPTVRKLRVASPFDYPRQAALYLPPHLPMPSDEHFADAVADELVALCTLSEGRAFALFTSLRNMERVYRLVASRLPYPLLLQGTRPKRALLEAFRAEPSVLFASHSFWEGVDVPGEALSLVVIDKLPFASPSEPQVSARIDRLRERGEDPFGRYQLPEAALALQQGFGRLIRSGDDHGVVAVLDPRISTRSYGRLFVESLPPATPIRSFEALQRWWQRTRAP